MSLSANVSEKAALIWAIADKLTGVYKPHEYGEVILPLTVIRRFDCILADTKDAVAGEVRSREESPHAGCAAAQCLRQGVLQHQQVHL